MSWSELYVADFPKYLIWGFVFFFGAAWGSFFNVAIYRWPRGMSVVNPPSHCPGCKKQIPFWRNVPILGWTLLRGKAACCGVKIPARYVGMEVLTGVVALALSQILIINRPDLLFTHAAFEWLLYFFFCGGLIVATFIDFEWMIIPDEISLPLTAIGLITASSRIGIDPSDAVLGAGAGFLIIQGFFVWGYEIAFGRRGMGEGDSKLLMAIGAFLGWKGALFALLAGSMQGIIGFIIGRGKEKADAKLDPIPREKLLEYHVDRGFGIVTQHDGRVIESGKELKQDDPLVIRVYDGLVDAKITKVEFPEEEGGRKAKIPFGPFLALAAIEFLFFGDRIIAWYASLFTY